MAETSDDKFLGGRLTLRQPLRGHRAGHDAILLAASTPAAPGQRIVDLGAGVGTAGLALAARIGGVDLTLVEIDPALAALAIFNAEANRLPARVVVADVAHLPGNLITPGSCDGVLMNPPFHEAVRHRASPDEARRIAHVASETTLQDWTTTAHRLLKPRGTVTLIWRADGLADILAVVSARFGSIALQPVHGAPEKPAVRILLKAIKGGRAPLVVHGAAILDGSDPRVEAAMRGDAALPMAGRALK